MGMRIEGGFALIAKMISGFTGKPRAMIDFMPHADRPPEDDPNRLATPEDIQRMFGVKRNG